MAHNPKLEVYSLILPKIEKNGNTFRDVLSEKLYGNGVKVGTDQEIFNDYFQNFISILDNPDFIADESKKKAITAYDTDPSRQKPSIGFKSEQFVIHGNIEGGRYGQKRNKSSMSNKMTKEDLTKDAIILDKFFFYLYTPFESDLGVLMIQSYTDDSISDVFLNCIKDLFHIKGYKKPKTPKFVPQAIIEEFSNDSFIKKFTYSSRFLLSQLSNNPIGEKDQHFNIKIEVVSTDDIPKGALPSWLSSLGDKIFNNAPLKDERKYTKVYKAI